jgi:hypothetical protein
MPFPKLWLPRLSEILADVQRFPSSDIDREAIMRLFGLKRRAALLLMKELNPRTERGSWYIDKKELLRWLKSREPEAEREVDRRARWGELMLRADLEMPRKSSPLLTVQLTAEQVRAVQDFPAGVSLVAGKPSSLTIEFQTVTELAEKVLRLGVAINQNLDRYVSLIEPDAARETEEGNELRRERDYILNWMPGDP